MKEIVDYFHALIVYNKGVKVRCLLLSKFEILDSLMYINKGFIKTSDAINAGVSRTYFGEYVRERQLERVAHGLYSSQEAWEDRLYVIQVRYPEAVFSHETALYLLGIAEREPTQYSVTLKAGTNSTGLINSGVKVYKVKPELFYEGIIDTQSQSCHKVRAYSPERTVCDLFRSRRNIEIQDLQAAIKEYVRLKEKNIPLLMRYAKLFSVEKIVRQYLTVFLS